ncbi:MAG: helix-turn-helix transcriptional regulator [Dehalococcoidia bacterium]
MTRANFRGLKDAILADPRRRAAFAVERRAMETALSLMALRQARGATQVEVAGAIGVSQANISRIEHQDDLYLSTLRAYVAALGGRLELLAVFPDQTICLDAVGDLEGGVVDAAPRIPAPIAGPAYSSRDE